jgi:UDPglucose--hexose-1-phosphate uridylyltransferase
MKYGCHSSPLQAAGHSGIFVNFRFFEKRKDLDMPELRHDPVTKRWVIIATDRSQRPSDFKVEKEISKGGRCPFCYGNESMTPGEIYAVRNNGTIPNSSGWQVRVIPNKFPALKIEGDLDREAVGHYDRMNGIGAHEVIIETPQHDKDLSDFSIAEAVEVYKAYRESHVDLQKDSRFRYILIFRNHGASAGASLEHSHSQIIATPITPRNVAIELSVSKEHYGLKERCLFCDLITQELQTHSRIVSIDEHYITYCPYASRFPFEMILLPRKHSHDFGSLTDDEMVLFARHMKEVLIKMRVALSDPPYNYIVHTAPSYQYKPRRVGYWMTISYDYHWHIEILPRLTKTAGFEWGSGFYINPTPPEEAAKYLREVSL